MALDTAVYDGHALFMGRLIQIGRSLDGPGVPLDSMLDTVDRIRLSGRWNPRGAPAPLAMSAETADYHQAVIVAAAAFRDTVRAFDTYAHARGTAAADGT